MCSTTSARAAHRTDAPAAETRQIALATGPFSFVQAPGLSYFAAPAAVSFSRSAVVTSRSPNTTARRGKRGSSAAGPADRPASPTLRNQHHSTSSSIRTRRDNDGG